MKLNVTHFYVGAGCLLFGIWLGRYWANRAIMKLLNDWPSPIGKERRDRNANTDANAQG